MSSATHIDDDPDHNQRDDDYGNNSDLHRDYNDRDNDSHNSNHADRNGHWHGYVDSYQKYNDPNRHDNGTVLLHGWDPNALDERQKDVVLRA